MILELRSPKYIAVKNYGNQKNVCRTEDHIVFAAYVRDRVLHSNDYGPINTGILNIYSESSFIYNDNLDHHENKIGYICFNKPYKVNIEDHIFIPSDYNQGLLPRSTECSFLIDVFLEKNLYEKIYQATIVGLVVHASIDFNGYGISLGPKGYMWDTMNDQYKRVFINNVSIVIDRNLPDMKDPVNV